MEEIQKKARKPAKEKVGFKHQVGWSSRAISMSIHAVLFMQVTYFCTNVLGMAPTLVGTILSQLRYLTGLRIWRQEC